MTKVFQMRAGAPDKAALAHSESIELIKLDHKNLVDFSISQICQMTDEGFILPADELDLKYVCSIETSLTHPERVILPRKDGRFVSYAQVSKASSIYERLVHSDDKEVEETIALKGQRKRVEVAPFDFLEFNTISVDKILEYGSSPVCLKTEYGSGSRGVVIIDPQRSKLGGIFTDKLTKADAEKLMNECRKFECGLVIQQLIPSTLMKVNIDFIIRDGQLLSYKWTEMNQSQLMTNWDNGLHIRTHETDEIMGEIVRYLQLDSGLMNFEAYFDQNLSKLSIIEFNWRYSNSMFEYEAWNYDPIAGYIENKSFFIPEGSHKFVRYWRCSQYSNLIPNDYEKLN